MDVGFILIATTQTGDLAALARRAEAVGVDSLWIPEHVVIPSGVLSPFPFAPSWPEHYGRWVDPFVALTVAATATTRLKLATGCVSCPNTTHW
jgi:alkanesulfonate monooxygenase SsuD/methylene tetrahydromethanopterin reductase-like flavin-dependent oxidoreductase (luciferase family)